MALLTPAADIGIDDSCAVLEPIDFTTAYLDTVSQKPVSHNKEQSFLSTYKIYRM